MPFDSEAPQRGVYIPVPEGLSLRVTELAAKLRRAQAICASRAVPAPMLEELARLLAEVERDLPAARAALIRKTNKETR